MIKSIDKASSFVLDFYANHNTQGITYHNYQRTLKLLKNNNKIVKDSELSASEATILQVALLFSDMGFSLDYHNPFAKSADLAKTFFEKEPKLKGMQEQVLNCLKVLISKQAKTDLEKVFWDTYYSDFSSKKFLKRNSLWRHEMNAFSQNKMDEAEWLTFQINQLSNHKYYTDYALLNWQPIQRKHLASLLRSKSKMDKIVEKERLKAKYKTKFKNESPERGIQTLYRVALRNHLKLSDIADTKANILLSVNAIIISLVLANLLSKFNDPSNRYLIIPTIIFVIFSIVSMIMSIRATQPNVTRGEFTEKDLKEKNVNLAFFGNFHKMELEKYQSEFKKLIQKKNDVYETLTTDLYYLGSVLDSKYRLLRYTYYVFMTGVVLSVLAFAISFAYRETITL